MSAIRLAVGSPRPQPTSSSPVPSRHVDAPRRGGSGSRPSAAGLGRGARERCGGDDRVALQRCRGGRGGTADGGTSPRSSRRPPRNRVVPLAPGFTEALRRVTRRASALCSSRRGDDGFRCSASRQVQPRGPRVPQAPRSVHTSAGQRAGIPAAALGGSAELMARLCPRGPVYQAGTCRESGRDGSRSRHPAAVRRGAVSPSRHGRAHRLQTRR